MNGLQFRPEEKQFKDMPLDRSWKSVNEIIA